MAKLKSPIHQLQDVIIRLQNTIDKKDLKIKKLQKLLKNIL